MHPKFQRFRSQFLYDRSLTLDLLKHLSNDDLLWSPGDSVGAFWKQFRHVGRVQENYVDAIKTGAVHFDTLGSYQGGADREALLVYLDSLTDLFPRILDSIDETAVVDWFGEEKLNIFDHLLRMMGHETLHHGQWIVYMKLMNKPFPEKFGAFSKLTRDR